MAETVRTDPADFIQPLSINGLEGRMLRMPMPARKTREILLVYGLETSIERWSVVASELNIYGAVIMPDLPGVGGMNSFYSIGKRPTIDNFADYLAAFVKLRFKRKRLTIVGLSFGFVVITRMLQRYPELTKKVDVVVSMDGLMHQDDFCLPPQRRRIYARAQRLYATRPVALVIRYCWRNGWVLRKIRLRSLVSKDAKAGNNLTSQDDAIDLLQTNDVRTHWFANSQLLNLDNCASRVDVPIWHVASVVDSNVDSNIVEQHMRIVFKDYHHAVATDDEHGMAIKLPKQLCRLLARKP